MDLGLRRGRNRVLEVVAHYSADMQGDVPLLGGHDETKLADTGLGTKNIHSETYLNARLEVMEVSIVEER